MSRKSIETSNFGPTVPFGSDPNWWGREPDMNWGLTPIGAMKWDPTPVGAKRDELGRLRTPWVVPGTKENKKQLVLESTSCLVMDERVAKNLELTH